MEIFPDLKSASKKVFLDVISMKNAKEEEKRSEKEKSLGCMTSKMNLAQVFLQN